MIGQAPTKTVILNPEDAVQWTLYYSASVSPRDYPFYSASAEQALAQLDGGGLDALTTAQLQHDAGQLDAAVESLAGLDSSEANETRGWIHLEQNQIREAIEQFGLATAASPRTRLGLSIAHYRANELGRPTITSKILAMMVA